MNLCGAEREPKVRRGIKPDFRMNLARPKALPRGLWASGPTANEREAMRFAFVVFITALRYTIGMKQIYLAGGCFWGAEKYLAMIPGVVKTGTGYANGRTAHPSYEDVCRKDTGHAETVKVEYDPAALDLPFLLDLFYAAIDPTSVNCQGHDRGTQYRTGIYYVDEEDRGIILDSIADLQKRYKEPVAVEIMPLENYYPAEEYHQKYLDKNPGGYCHIGADTFDRLRRLLEQHK
jgi:peptide methionine sulfoxide reductase msrA/msrB